jgi:hypothetical protein
MMMGRKSELFIIPRTKQDSPEKSIEEKISRKIAISVESLGAYFDLPLEKAAKALGVSPTALKWCVQCLFVCLVNNVQNFGLNSEIMLQCVQKSRN